MLLHCENRRFRRLGMKLLLALMVIMLGACGAEQGMTSGPVTPAVTITEPGSSAFEATGVPAAAITESVTVCVQRVLIISLDGLRPDALSQLRTPNMMRLAARGAFAPRAQTIRYTGTLPAHASMLSGYDLFGHGILWNAYIPWLGFIRRSTVFSIASENGLHTAMLVGKDKLFHIAAPGTVDDYAYIPDGDQAIVRAGVERIEQGFGVLFIHLRALDSAGHRHGWMSPSYLEAVSGSDTHVGELLDALRRAGLDETTLVILTADHGGSGTNHGSGSVEDRTIPWIVAGPGVVAGLELDGDVSVMDTAATALWALGLPLPDDLDGRPIVQAFGAGVEEWCSLEHVWR